MPNYGYHLARAHGKVVRTVYSALLPGLARRSIPKSRDVPVTVVAYCGERTVPEQVVSIRSFLKHVGRPNRFMIVSDGTLTARSRTILSSLDSSISVSDSAEWLPKDLPAKMYPYLTTHPTGKQLALIMSLPITEPTFYVDSDVLFFAGAHEILHLLDDPGAPALYLTDCQLSADLRLFRDESEKARPVNTGALLLFERMDWTPAIRRFLELEGLPVFFTNQTMTQLTMHANGAVPFDGRKYVLQLDDQFVFGDRYASPHLVLRHYVNPVRHKLWATLRRFDT